METLEKTYQSFLTKKQVSKLRVFKKILMEKRVNTEDLCVFEHKSATQIRSILKEINDEKMELRENDEKIIRVGKNIVHLSKEYTPTECLKFFTELRKLYFQNSPYYEMFLFFLVQRKTTIQEVCLTISVSISYAYKMIDRLNLKLKQFEMPFVIEKKQKTVELVGDETSMRMQHYMIKIIAESGYVDIALRSRTGDQQSDSIYAVAQTIKIKQDLMFHIVHNAVKQGFAIEKLAQRDTELYERIALVYQDPRMEAILSRAEETIILSERALYYFSMLLLIPERINDTYKIKIVKEFQNLPENQLVVFAESIIEQLKKEFRISKRNQDFLIFEIIINTWGYEHLNLNKFTPRDPMIDVNDNLRKICQTIEFNLAKSSIAIDQIELFSIKLARVIYSYVHFGEKDSVQIGISTLKNPEFAIMIQNTLSKIYNPAALKFTQELEKADVVVSDTVINNQHYQEFIYVGDVHSKDEWNNLNLIVNNAIMQRSK